MKKILIADDDKNSSLILTGILNEYYEIIPAYNTPDMFVLYDSENVDMIIISSGFQQISPANLISTLKKSKKNERTPIVVIASEITQNLVIDCKKTEVSDLIKKPYEPINLITRIADTFIKNTPLRERRDELTGLNNRVFASDKIQEWMNSEKSPTGSMMLIDIDKYTFARGSVDKTIIRNCAAILQKQLNKGEVLSRLSDSRFIVYTKNLSDRDSVKMKAEMLIKYLEKETKPENLSVTIGLAIFPEHGTDYADLFKNCDLALHLAHQQGKNIVCFYN